MKRSVQEVPVVFLASDSTLTFADAATSHSLALIVTVHYLHFFFFIPLIATKTYSQLSGQSGIYTF